MPGSEVENEESMVKTGGRHVNTDQDNHNPHCIIR